MFRLCIFQGVNQEEVSDDYEGAIVQGLVSALQGRGVEVRCFSPPPLRTEWDATQHRAWVNFDPLPDETFEATRHAPRSDEQVAATASAAIEWACRPGLLAGAAVGISNGGVVACELAVRHPSARIAALGLVSSAPTPEQEERLLESFRGALVQTIGSEEHYWDGSAGLYSVASSLLSDVLAFRGGHCEEPQELLRRLGRTLGEALLRTQDV